MSTRCPALAVMEALGRILRAHGRIMIIFRAHFVWSHISLPPVTMFKCLGIRLGSKARHSSSSTVPLLFDRRRHFSTTCQRCSNPSACLAARLSSAATLTSTSRTLATPMVFIWPNFLSVQFDATSPGSNTSTWRHPGPSRCATRIPG